MYKLLSMVFTTILICGYLSLLSAQPSSLLDSAELYYTVAVKNYNKKMFEKSVQYIKRQSVAEQKLPASQLLLGFIYWRLELIAYCLDSAEELDRYGKLSLDKLSAAEDAGANVYLTATHKALVCQLLASQGIKNGAMYGPRAAAELKKALKVDEYGYFTQLVDAVNKIQAPKFVGGNPKKAVVQLEKMAAAFPDSVDVKIHLTDAYLKIGSNADAQRLIEPVVKKYPKNLLARKVAENVLY